MFNANVLACYVSNVGIVWFYTLIINPYYNYCSYCFYYLYILFLYFVISPVTGSLDLLELNKLQYSTTQVHRMVIHTAYVPILR